MAVVSATSVKAYVLQDYRWPSATTTFNVDMPGGDGLWNQAFESAMARWNVATIFEFKTMRDTLEGPCDGLPTRTTGGDSENGVAFVSDVCGEPFGENVLAVENSWSQGTRTIQSNIHFNDAYSWNVYDEPYETGSWRGVVDFRRVAVHELGHALGLGHEDDVTAIMATEQRRGNTIVEPQADDIAGVATLYGEATLPPAPPSPPNDRFSNATRISGPSGRATGSNVNAAAASGEPGSGSKSVWWQWRSPSNGTATIDTVGSSFDTILGVYTGTRVDALTRLAESDNAAGIGRQSRVTLRVTAGTVYWLRVSGLVSPFGGGATGNIVLNWNLEEAGVSAEHKYIFPQFPFGGGWASTLTLAALNEDETTCKFSAQGRHMTLRAVSGHTAFGTEIPLVGFKSGQWNIFKTEAPDGGPVSSGMAILQCDRAVLTHTLFSLTVGGSLVAEALVEPSHEFKAFEEYVLFYADHRNGARFGVAVANPSDRAIDVSVQVSDDQGEVVVDATVNIDANTSKAFFLDELGTIPEGHTGGVALRAGESLYVIGLRFTGQVFTTIPAW